MENQEIKFMTGNEMVAEAAKAIQFHFMGYYPITPSTEIAQLIDKMKSQGEVTTVLLPADGEHGAAGACLGASSGGARVLNATSSNGFLYSLEQLPVQAGLRLPMVLNLVTRSVSGPLDIRCDHSDLMFALQTGWIILLAPTPQAVYDMNILAVKLGEHPKVRLPVMVVSDGFFTSHQRQSCQVFKDIQSVQNFIGKRDDPFTTLDPRKPITMGPYMNDPDLINNKYQLHLAHEAAAKIYDEISADYEKLSGRKYPRLATYNFDQTSSALFLINSAVETAKDAIDKKKSEGKNAGLIYPHILRPFPFEEIKSLSHQLSSIVIGERSDTPGSVGGPLSHEIRSALLADQHCDIKVLCRVYGLGGKDFREEDAEEMLEIALKVNDSSSSLKNSSSAPVFVPDSESESVSTSVSNEKTSSSIPLFGFIGIEKGQEKVLPPQLLPPFTKEELRSDLVKIEILNESFPTKIRAHVADPSKLAMRPKRLASGHGACPGCGIFSGLDQFFKGIEGEVVVLYHTGCAMVVTTDYPFSAHRVTYIHNLFQNGAPTLSGLVEAFWEKKRRGEISADEDITFIMITGDGGMDIGMGPTIGTALRNHHMIILEYDNHGYMNTGGQLSYTTPFAKNTSTSHVGKKSFGKSFHHKDTVGIMAATGIPYLFTAVEGIGTDLVAKAAKAQWYAKNRGLAFGKILVSCPLNWGAEEKMGYEILQKAVDCCFFPLYEIEDGLTSLSYDPEKDKRKIPVEKWLEMMGKSQHLLKAENSDRLQELQNEIEKRWKRLKALSEHPLL